MRAPLAVSAACAVLLGAGVPLALAALPAGNAVVEAHDHGKEGRNFHVQLDVGGDPRRLDSVLLFTEQCGETHTQNDVPVAEDGSVAAGGPLDGGGSWEVKARFTAAREATGTYRVRLGRCDTGERPFRARRAVTGKGHGDHGGGGGHGAHGNHGPKFPPLKRATPAQRRQAEGLRRQVWRMTRARFSSYEAAKRRGFVRFNKKWGRPVVFHLRSWRFDTDAISLSASRPESLVYWWPRSGKPILLGFMFRVPAPGRPAFGGPIPIYHRHPSPNGKLGRSQMTHVWLTHDLKSAWANCLPVDELEKAHPRFRYRKQGNGNSGVEARPCTPQTPVRKGETHTVAVGDNWFVEPEGVPTLTVERGDTVRWNFVGKAPHNVSVGKGPARFESPVRRTGSFERRLTTKGTYQLLCTIHGADDQRMRVVVK